MAEDITPNKKPSLPVWNCKLEPKINVTVGQKLSLSCQGFDELPVGKRYELVNDQDDPYFLHLLKVRQDKPLQKDFIVTPYRVYKGSLVLRLKDTEADSVMFQAGINDIKISSVIENKSEAQMAGPQGPSLLQYSPAGLVGFSLFIVFLLGLIIFKLFKQKGFKKDFSYTMSMVNYQNPFIDLNLDLADIERNRKKLDNLKPHIEMAFKKFFYNLFKKPIFFDNPTKLNYELKKLKIQDHELRAIGIIKNDFDKIQSGVQFDLDTKRAFIGASKKSLNKLRRYYDETGL